MRDLSNIELGYVYGAGGSCKKGGSHKSTKKSHKSTKKSHKSHGSHKSRSRCR